MEISSIFLPGGLRKALCVVGVESESQRLNRLIFSYLEEGAMREKCSRPGRRAGWLEVHVSHWMARGEIGWLFHKRIWSLGSGLFTVLIGSSPTTPRWHTAGPSPASRPQRACWHRLSLLKLGARLSLWPTGMAAWGLIQSLWSGSVWSKSACLGSVWCLDLGFLPWDEVILVSQSTLPKRGTVL